LKNARAPLKNANGVPSSSPALPRQRLRWVNTQKNLINPERVADRFPGQLMTV